MSWYVPEDMLSNSQKQVIDEIVNDSSNYFYIKGFTGTGKTILLLHIMTQLLRKNPNLNICFLTYTDTLVELAKSSTLFYDYACKIQILTNRMFIGNSNSTYDYLLIDEIQDMTIEDLIKMRAISAKIVCVGDFNQQMYLHRVTESELIKVLNPKIYEMTDIFRLTKFLCKFAYSIAPKTKIAKGLRAHNNPKASIRLGKAEHEEDEFRWLWHEALARAEPGFPSCVLLPSFRLINQFAMTIAQSLNLPAPPIPVKYRGRCDYTDFNQFWQDQDVSLRYIDNTCPNIQEAYYKSLVLIMTYHNSKGLSFRNVFIPLLSSNTTIIKNNIDLESRLLFTACTRASENLFLSYSGDQIHYLLKNIPSDCYREHQISPKLGPAQAQPGLAQD